MNDEAHRHQGLISQGRLERSMFRKTERYEKSRTIEGRR